MPANPEALLLMASSQRDMEDWVQAIRRVIWAPLGGGTARSSHAHPVKPLPTGNLPLPHPEPTSSVWLRTCWLCPACLSAAWPFCCCYEVTHTSHPCTKQDPGKGTPDLTFKKQYPVVYWPPCMQTP